MKKIVIAGASVYGLNNISDDSMLKVLCNQLHSQISELEITILLRHPNSDFDSEMGIVSIHNLDHQSREESKGRWFNGLNNGDTNENIRKIHDKIAAADLLIIGGDPFIDITMGFYKGIIPYSVLLITLAKFLGTKVMINGIHMCRALNTEAGIEQTKFCIQNADLITIRDNLTIQHFKDLGINDFSHILSLADASYGLDPIKNKNQGIDILSREGIKYSEQRWMGITFRHMYWRWKPDDWERYSTMIAQVADKMHEIYGFNILFIPHNTYEKDTKYMDDRPGHAEIFSKMKYQSAGFLIRNRLSVQETLSLFPLLEIVLSNRRHSAIYAAIHGNVALGIGELPHVMPPMEQLNIGKEMFVDIEDFSFDKIFSNLVYILENKDIIREKIIHAIPQLRALALENANQAVNLINNQ